MALPYDPEERRLQFQDELEALIGSSHVYYQTPENIRMSYPCYVYRRSSGDAKYADDSTYAFRQLYELIAIDRNPDSDLAYKAHHHFPMSRMGAHYEVDGLNHDVVMIYY